jgi:hypothetical protein
MNVTAAIIMAESTIPRLKTADFSLCTVRVSLPGRPDQVEAVLTPEQIARLRKTIGTGLRRGRLIYPLNGRRRVIDLDTGRARWAGDERPDARTRA